MANVDCLTQSLWGCVEFHCAINGRNCTDDVTHRNLSMTASLKNNFHRTDFTQEYNTTQFGGRQKITAIHKRKTEFIFSKNTKIYLYIF